MNERDTHFASFAKLLFQELPPEPDKPYSDEIGYAWCVACENIIAQCAYDLVEHVLLNTSHYNMDALTMDEQVERIPDMVGWPER